MQLIDSIQTYYVHNISASHINLQRFGVSVIYKYVVAHLGSSHLKVQKIVVSWFDFWSQQCVWSTFRQREKLSTLRISNFWDFECKVVTLEEFHHTLNGEKKGVMAECSGSRVEEDRSRWWSAALW